MIPQLLAGLVRIITSEGELAGVGFLITPRQILCTASSVLAALKKTADAEGILYDLIAIQFAEDVNILGRVVGWHPSTADEYFDAAILEVAPNAVVDANPLRLSILEDPIDHQFKTLGFGPDQNETVLAVGRFVSLNPDETLLIEELEPGDTFLLPGFLGAPVWDDRAQAVVGMLNLAETEAGVRPVVVSFNTLIDSFPDIPIRLPTETPGQLHNVPDLPPHFVMRSTDFRRLRAALLAGRQQRSRRTTISGTTGSMGITSTGPADSMRSERIVLQGPPGIGKTSLAAAVVRDEYLRRIYPDGIFWLHLGGVPELTLAQSQLAKMAGAPYGAYIDPRQGRRMLRGLISDRACLIVLDDVWDPAVAASFDCLGPRGMLLVIGPEIGLAGSLRARRLQLGPMTDEEATKLICNWSGVQEADYASEIPPILLTCDYNPLAVSLAGAMLDNDATRWASLLAQVGRLDLAAVMSKMGYFAYQKILSILTMAVKFLPEDARKLFMEMALFPPGEPVPVSTVQKLWMVHNLDPDTAQDIIMLLIRGNLLQKHEDEQGRLEIIMHDFISTYLRTFWSDLAPLHQQLLKSYGNLPPNDDGWILDNLVYHLRSAGQVDDLRKLLFDFRYMLQRLVASGIDGLLHDYIRALATPSLSFWDRDKGSQELTIIENALRMSAYTLASDYQALPGQLIARLNGYEMPLIQQLLSGVQHKQDFAWLRPLTSSLSHPGSKRLLFLNGHKGKINALVTSLDGRMIITAGQDRLIRLWDLDSGRLIRTLRGHDGPVSDLSLSPEGKHLISASFDGSAKIWQLSDGVCLQTLTGHKGRVLKLAITHDGRRLITAGSDYKIHIWSLENGGLIGSYQMHEDWVRALAILPGSLQAVSASREIKVWDIETGQVMYTLSGHQDKINALAITPDGQRLLSISDDQLIYIWDLQTGAELRSIRTHAGRLTGLALMPGIHLMVTISNGNNLSTWNLDSGRLVDRQEIPGSKFTSISVSPAGRKLIAAGEGGSIFVWDWTNRRRLRVMRGHTSRINAVSLLPDGKHIVSASSDGSIRMWELANGHELYSLQSQGPGINALVCSPDGQRIFSGSEDGTIKIWDLLNQFATLVLEGHSGPVLSLDITPDGKRLISASADATMIVWDVEPTPEAPLGLAALQSILYGHTSWVRGVAALPDNWRAISVSADRTLKLWDLDTGQVLYSIEFLQGELNDAAVLMNGLRIVTAGDDQVVRILDVQTGHPQFRLIGHSGEVNAVAATPDGKRIVSVSHDRTVRVWDIPTKRRPRRGGRDDLEGVIIQNSMILEDHTDWIQAVAVTTDGRRAISASDDSTLRQWDISHAGDVSLGLKPKPQPGHVGGVYSLSFSADGRYILSSGADKKTCAWMLNRSADGGISSILEKFSGRFFPTTARLLRFFKDGVHFCTADQDNAVQVWDIDQDDKPLRSFQGFSNKISQLACSPDGRKIAVAEPDNVKIMSVADGQVTSQFDFPDQNILALEFMQDHRRLSVLCSDGNLTMLDAISGKVISEFDLGVHNKPVRLAVTKVDPLNKKIAAWIDSGELALWNIPGSTAQQAAAPSLYAADFVVPNPPEYVQGLAFADHGRNLAVASTQDFIVYDLENPEQDRVRFQTDTEILTVEGSNQCSIYAAGDQVGHLHFLVLER